MGLTLSSGQQYGADVPAGGALPHRWQIVFRRDEIIGRADAIGRDCAQWLTASRCRLARRMRDIIFTQHIIHDIAITAAAYRDAGRLPRPFHLRLDQPRYQPSA